MSVPILAAKLYIPPLRSNLVPRPRLIQRLDEDLYQPEGFTRRLTMISAPAGYGKTTLAVEWLRRGNLRSAWLSLDEGDNDPARFLTYLIAALRQIHGKIGRDIPKLLQTPQPPPPEVILAGLVNEIAGFATPFLLAMDDYHLIHAPAVHQQLNFILEYLPTNVHLVILAREDPPVPIVRLRARGQMAEIRQADLSFTLDETSEFLQKSTGLELNLEEIHALAQRTEGWPAGLHMAALALHRLAMQSTADVHSFVQSFAGSNRYVLDYLFEEVFHKQPAGVQDFLLKTSVLNRLSAPLCDFVAERSDSYALLDELERSNLFITRVDPSNEWFRYHPLFAELLRHRLRMGSESQERSLHLKASLWLEQKGFPEDAIHHALSAGDWGCAVALVNRMIDSMLMRGEFITLIGWFKRFPEGMVRSNPRLCLAYAWPLLLASQLEPVEALLTHAEKLAGEDTALLGEIAAAQAYHAQVRGDGPRLVERSERALALLPESNLIGRGLVALTLGLAYWHSGRLVDTERAMEIALPAARKTGNDFAVVTALIFQARNLAVRGQLRQAEENLRQILEFSPRVSILALAHLDLGTINYEWNNLESAAGYIQSGLENAWRSGNVEFQMSGFDLLARLRLAQRDLSGALEAARQAHQLSTASHAPLRAEARLTALQVELALAQGDLEQASQRSHDLPDDVDMHPFYRFLGLSKARLLIAQGRKKEAAHVLQARFARAVQSGWEYGAIAARILQALAADEPEAALMFLKDAIKRAQPEGYIRTFADAGEGLISLLIQSAQRGVAPEYVGRILVAIRERSIMPAGRLSFLVEPASRRVNDTLIETATQSANNVLVEPLSERELEVLRLVAAGLSNREIGERLVVSPGTAKTHVHNIFGKLGASNRAQAVARAKELSLI